MIVDRPAPKDFERQSIQYLIQSIDLITSNDHKDEDIEDYEVDMAECWKYHQGILNNSLTLLFLSLENLIKKEICKISPLMLLADEPKKWGGRTSSKKFSELFILQFDDLIAIYQELGLGKISDQTASKLEDLRKKRNQITHGVIEDNITPQYILDIFYTLMVHIWGPGIWWTQLKEHIFNEPLFGIYDSDHEKASVTTYIEFFVSYLGNKRTGEMLGHNLKQRNYFCPECHYWLNHEWDVTDSKYAILSPNTPSSETLFCVVCSASHNVERKKCQEDDCKGNVICMEGRCLTCFSEQDYR